MVNYPYRWSFNISINPIHIVMIVIWKGHSHWHWYARRPLTIVHVVDAHG